MKVILTQKVAKLGEVGNVVDVASGYGRNYLIPRKLAVLADARNVRRVEHEKAVIDAQQRRMHLEAQDLAGKIGQVSVSVPVKVGEQGKLYGSVTSRDVVAALSKAGYDVDRRQVQLDEPLREVGEYDVPVKIHSDVTATVKVQVVPEEE